MAAALFARLPARADSASLWRRETSSGGDHETGDTAGCSGGSGRGALHAGDPARAGQIPFAPDDLRGAVPGRRHHRPAGAHIRAEGGRSVRPVGRGGEHRRRRRLDRRRQGREGRARRLHAAPAQRHVLDHHHVAAIHRPRQAQFRRLHAGVACGQRAADPDVPSFGAGEEPEGVRHLRQGDRQGGVLRHDRAGQRDASLGRDAEARHRHQDGPRAVPRRRAAGAGAAHRPHPARRRPDLDLARPCARRRAARRSRRCRRRAPCRCPNC